MAHIKAYSNHLEDLVKGLPMDDTHFITKLSVQQLLPGDTENKIKSMGTPADKASHFLSVVIKPALDINDTSDFEKLISVMQNCGFNRVKKLADTIKFEIDNDETTPHVSGVYVRNHILLCICKHNYVKHSIISIIKYGST